MNFQLHSTTLWLMLVFKSISQKTEN